MNILVIGNGFDIAHGLPTRYKEFLKTCESVRETKVLWVGDEPTVSGEAVLRETAKSFCDKVGSELYSEFYKIINSNFWIQHFEKRQHEIGDDWLSFEKEIKVYLNSIVMKDKDEDDTFRHIPNRELANYCNAIGELQGLQSYRSLFSFLLEEHKKLLRALEIYLDGYVNKVEAHKNAYVSDRTYEHVLSFNYTDTFTRVYNNKLKPCFVHGHADTRNNIENCNLVLGYDDHYLENVSIVRELIPFQKYYQRIVKSTDTQYYEWVPDVPTTLTTNVYFFGHSMDPEDGDILRKLIMNKHTHVTIYYYDQLDRAEKIKNLAIVLTPDVLINYTGGETKKIVFESDRMID